jgi:hypothetical protein
VYETIAQPFATTEADGKAVGKTLQLKLKTASRFVGVKMQKAAYGMLSNHRIVRRAA